MVAFMFSNHIMWTECVKEMIAVIHFMNLKFGIPRF